MTTPPPPPTGPPLNISVSDWYIQQTWRQTREAWRQPPPTSQAPPATPPPPPTGPPVNIKVSDWHVNQTWKQARESWRNPTSTNSSSITRAPTSAASGGAAAGSAVRGAAGGAAATGGAAVRGAAGAAVRGAAGAAARGIAGAAGGLLGPLGAIAGVAAAIPLTQPPKARRGRYREGLRNYCAENPSAPVCQAAPVALPAEQPPPTDTQEIQHDPPFTGGQSPGVKYVALYIKNHDNSVNFEEVVYGPVTKIGWKKRDEWTSWPEVCGSNGCTIADNNYGTPYQASDSLGQYRYDTRRWDGAPDTGGDPPGTTETAPASSPPQSRPTGVAFPPPATPEFAPPPASIDLPGMQPTPPPLSTGTGEPAAPPAPGSLPAGDPIAPPTEEPEPPPKPQLDPDGTPTGAAAPAATGGNTPSGMPTLAQGGGQGAPGQRRAPAGGTGVTGGPQPTQELEPQLEIGPHLIPELTPIPAIMPAGGTKLKNPAKPGEFTQPDPPKEPPKSPPATDNPCKCNAPVMQRFNGLEQKLDNLLGGSNLAAGGTILDRLGRLEAFLKKAWETTRLSKVIELLTLITVLHNASMISREVGETLGYAISNGLAAVGIKDENNNPIDVNQIIGTTTTNWIKSILGEDVYNNLRDTWIKANNILRSASMVIWTMRSIMDSTQEVLEWTSENTGKIGNALKRWGVVGRNAYPWMAEKVHAQDAVRRRYRRILDGLESAEDTASSFAMVTGEVREITEEVNELKQNRQRFTDSVRDFTAGAEPDNSQIPTNAAAAITNSQSPEAQPADLERGDSLGTS